MATTQSHIFKGNVDAIWTEVILIAQGAGYKISDSNEQNKQITYQAGGGGWAWGQNVKIDLSKMGDDSTLISFHVEAAGQATLTEGGQQRELIQFMVDQVSQKFPIDESQVRNIPNAPGAGCFTQNTKIRSAIGDVPISTLSVNDLVWSCNVARNSFFLRRVIKVLQHQPEEIFEISLGESGKKIRTTANHRFFSENRWIATKNLSSGSLLVCVSIDNRLIEMPICKIHKTGELEPVYNIYTEIDCNFIAEDFLAHNFSFSHAFRESMERNFFSALRPMPVPDRILEPQL